MPARDARDSRAVHPAAPDHAPPRRPGAAPHPLMALQSSAGNAAVVQLLRSSGHAEAHGAVVVQRAGDENGESSKSNKGKAVKRDNGRGQQQEEEEAASAQGEHVFNALDDLARQFAAEMERIRSVRVGLINAAGKAKTLSPTQLTRATARINPVKTALAHLNASATEAGTERDHERFRSASHGGPKGKGGDQNSKDYGRYKSDVMATLATCGTRDWRDAQQLRDLQGRLLSTIRDDAAADVLRNEDLVGGTKGSSVGKKRTNTAVQQEFDAWVRDTARTMTELFQEMIDTANALHTLLRETRRGALGFGDVDDGLSGTDADPDSDPEE
ncbi:hypothetical protein ACIQKB_07565 [Streptomyces sp. NPDC092046]|uniref:hypothetical protein n=1 Tax=Streptomyces sp. NPDC092046 TaxID=3366009 RepID=UPI00380BD8CF